MGPKMKFYSSSLSKSDINTYWISTANSISMKSDIPIEFNGKGDGFSPEDYYSLALQNCFIATFKVIADKSKLNFDEISVELILVLDKDQEEKMIMHQAFFKIHLTGTPNKERALRILEKTKNSCMILNSVKTQLFFEFQI